jgi:hypothetical protein
MNNLDRLNLAEKRYMDSKEALVGFAKFHVPDRIRSHFMGDSGREVFIHSAVYGNPVWPRELEERFGDAVRRAHRFLIAMPRFRMLFDLNYEAYVECAEARYRDEADCEEYAISVEETYQMIDRDMAADVRDECLQLGLVA